MISAIVLNKEIRCEILCQEVQRLVNDYNREHGNTNDTVLVMNIKKIVHSQDDLGPPRLEYKSISD